MSISDQSLPDRLAERLGQQATGRRNLLKASLALGASASVLATTTARADNVRFAHGVASGDPLADRVIIWTRVAPALTGEALVGWKVATDRAFTNVVASGVATTTAARDYTVKVDVEGLSPDTRYHFRFESGRTKSPVGFTRTLPVGSVDRVKLAVFSCSNFNKGYFNVYNAALQAGSLNAVVHLGDYLYEYAPGGYTTPALLFGLAAEIRNDQMQPPVEITLLDHYRARHATYRTDRDLQALAAKAPWITIWDDHEITNDAWTGGAQNHNAGEGDWQTRKAAAIQAYYEWMPIREPADGNRVDPVTGNPRHHYRAFDFGDLAKLAMLDTRLAGRSQQKSTTDFLNMYFANGGGTFPLDVEADGVTSRSLLGTEQETWLAGQVAASNAAGQIWQIIGNQVLMHYQIAADFVGSPLFNASQKAQLSAMVDNLFGPGAGIQFGQLGQLGAPNPATEDTWMGYPRSRNRMLGLLAQARNPVVISGDSHNFWAAEIKIPTAGGRVPIATEFGTASVSSPGYEQTFPQIPGVLDIDPAVLADLIVQSTEARSPSDKLVFADTVNRGFMLLNISKAAVRTDFVMVDNVGTRAYGTTTKSFRVRAGAKTIEKI